MIASVRAWWSAWWHRTKDVTVPEARDLRDRVLPALQRHTNGEGDLEEARQLLRDLDRYYDTGTQHGSQHRH